MTKAFIVRPFGVKQNVDFEKVDKELIQPALEQLNIIGTTTTAIVEQGNIAKICLNNCSLKHCYCGCIYS